MTTATREHPILFNGPMVRAILEGQKTQTRRVVRPQPQVLDRKDGGINLGFKNRKGQLVCTCPIDLPQYEGQASLLCPYGQPGGQLWVRETWALKNCGRRVSLSAEAWPTGWPTKRVKYLATDKAPNTDKKGQPHWWNSRPSIHMPRWASRITLEVTGVRVERLQEISAEDAQAEGITEAIDYDPEGGKFVDGAWMIEEFHELWDSINAKRGFSWDSNPWVWVIEFKRKTR